MTRTSFSVTLFEQGNSSLKDKEKAVLSWSCSTTYVPPSSPIPPPPPGLWWMAEPSKTKYHTLAFTMLISSQGKSSCNDLCSTKGNYASKSDRAWVQIPLRSMTVLSNPLSWSSHRATCLDKVGLDRRYLKGFNLVTQFNECAKK